LHELEQSPARPSWTPLGIDLQKGKWVMSAEGFYRGVFRMIWNLAKDASQMRRAERRFQKGKILHTR
jgi:hypothetical protein